MSSDARYSEFGGKGVEWLGLMHNINRLLCEDNWRERFFECKEETYQTRDSIRHHLLTTSRR
jgi:hypothetical protein